MKRLRNFGIPTTRLAIVADFRQPLRVRLGWRIIVTVLLLIFLALLGLLIDPRLLQAAPSVRPLAQGNIQPLVLAYYYAWFDENTWSYDQLSDMPAQPYVSRDRGTMGRQIDEAKRAGIDGFLVAWYGPGGGPNQTETNLAAMLEEAAARDFRIGILFETDSPFFGGVGDVTAALQHIQNVHANHPAYLRANGRPVVFFWRPSIYSVDTWRTIRAQSNPDYSNIWIAEGVDTSLLAVFDGHHLYSNTWNPPADLSATNGKFAKRVAEARDGFGAYKLWVATVMPGYNDTRIRSEGFARDRAGGDYYALSWQAAINSRPDWIVINSYNEWPEGTYIEPSVAFGDLFLIATAGWSQQYKTNGSATIQSAALSVASPPAAPTPLPEVDTPTAFVDVTLLNLRSGPGTEYSIKAQLPAGTALPIEGSHADWPDWWQVKFNDETGWIYTPLVQAAGPLEQIPSLHEVTPTAGLQTAIGRVITPLLHPKQDTLKPNLSR